MKNTLCVLPHLAPTDAQNRRTRGLLYHHLSPPLRDELAVVDEFNPQNASIARFGVVSLVWKPNAVLRCYSTWQRDPAVMSPSIPARLSPFTIHHTSYFTTSNPRNSRKTACPSSRMFACRLPGCLAIDWTTPLTSLHAPVFPFC